MGILLDVIFLLIVAICVLVAVKKGFVRSLIEVLGYVLAIVLVFSFSTVISEYVYTGFVEEPIINAVETTVVEQGTNAYEQLPTYIKALISKANLDVSAFSAESAEGASELALKVENSVEPYVVAIIKTIVSFVVFALSLLIARILAKFVNSLFKGAVLGTANKFLGAIIGLVKGAVIGAVYSLIVYLSTVLPSVEALSFTTEALNNSVICKYLVTLIIGHI